MGRRAGRAGRRGPAAGAAAGTGAVGDVGTGGGFFANLGWPWYVAGGGGSGGNHNPPADTTAPRLTVSGTASGDVTVSGGSKGSFSGSGASYTLVVSPNPNSSGNLALSVAAGAAQDAAGNPNTAASAAAQAYDTLPDYPPGQAVIDLGVYGKLLHPVKVDGENWYYVMGHERRWDA